MLDVILYSTKWSKFNIVIVNEIKVTSVIIGFSKEDDLFDLT